LQKQKETEFVSLALSAQEAIRELETSCTYTYNIFWRFV